MASNFNGIGYLAGFGIFALLALLSNELNNPSEPSKSSEQPEVPEPPSEAVQKRLYELGMERSVKNILRDPDSAVFRHVALHCGYVNAKNGFGGYTGFTRFIGNPDAEVGLETEDNHDIFDKKWRENC